MSTIPLQDNLSKVQAVQDIYQQMLRFPDDLQQTLAGHLRKQRWLHKRKVNKSEKSDGSKLNEKKESQVVGETEVKGRRENLQKNTEEELRQCCIDFRV